MRLVGAKKFLRIAKSGTLYAVFSFSNEEECFNLIEKYNDGEELSERIEIFGDNSGSLAFIKNDEKVSIGGKEFDCIFYYDANVVGDASPETTLYLIYEDADFPSKIEIEQSNGEFLSKDDVFLIRKWFLENHTFKKEYNDWALNELISNDYFKNNKVINYKGSRKLPKDEAVRREFARLNKCIQNWKTTKRELEKTIDELKSERDYLKALAMQQESANVEKIEKELKALEIIKKKSVWGKNLVNEVKTSEDYTKYAMNYGILHWSCLTQEEFDLLKEVFEND